MNPYATITYNDPFSLIKLSKLSIPHDDVLRKRSRVTFSEDDRNVSSEKPGRVWFLISTESSKCIQDAIITTHDARSCARDLASRQMNSGKFEMHPPRPTVYDVAVAGGEYESFYHLSERYQLSVDSRISHCIHVLLY